MQGSLSLSFCFLVCLFVFGLFGVGFLFVCFPVPHHFTFCVQLSNSLTFLSFFSLLYTSTFKAHAERLLNFPAKHLHV